MPVPALSDNDRLQLIAQAAGVEPYLVVDVYPDQKNLATGYAVIQDAKSSKLTKREYTLDEQGRMSLASRAIPVRARRVCDEIVTL